jgi:UDP-glucuronate 4-epimerase
MNILVTGAAGFIGSHVCEHYLTMGNFVVGIDNFDNFYPKEIKLANITDIQTYPNFLFYEIDIRNQESLDKLFTEQKPDLVIHLAAKAGVRPSMDSIAEYYDVNINGTICLLEIMRKHDVKKMLFASSSSVYGNNSKVPFSETDPVDNPISPYAATKKSGELLCHVYCHLYGFDITCLRLFTVFGPRQRPDLAIHKFTKNILEGEPIQLFGDGSTSRDYTFILDIINGIECAMNHLDGYKIYNLGESRIVSLSKLVQTIEDILGKKALISYLPLQPGDVNITYADISKAKSEIGYNPQYNLYQGISEFAKWYIQKSRK